MELGFIPGASVRVVAAAPPSGDPVAVRIGRATFALRLFEAELVRVAVASSGPG
jgi:ferrous iron transport protein A